MRYHIIQARTTIIKNLQNINPGKGAKRELSYTISGNINVHNHDEEDYGDSLKKTVYRTTMLLLLLLSRFSRVRLCATP